MPGCLTPQGACACRLQCQTAVRCQRGRPDARLSGCTRRMCPTGCTPVCHVCALGAPAPACPCRCLWTPIRTAGPCPAPRKMHAAVVAKGWLIVLGGERDTGAALDELWTLRLPELPPGGAWHELLGRGGEELRCAAADRMGGKGACRAASHASAPRHALLSAPSCGLRPPGWLCVRQVDRHPRAAHAARALRACHGSTGRAVGCVWRLPGCQGDAGGRKGAWHRDGCGHGHAPTALRACRPCACAGADADLRAEQ